MATSGLAAEKRDCIRILDVAIDRTTMAKTLAQVESYIASGKPHLIVTADAASVVIAHRNPEFKKIVNGADLVTPDGNGIVWASKRQGRPVEQRVSGVDIAEKLCALSAKSGYRIYFLGAAPGVAALAAENLMLKYPGCQIVGSHDGYFSQDTDESVAAEIAAAKPDILLVAMGMPRQEQFIRKTENITGAKVAMGVGGTFDVFSGKTKRAPKLVQKLKLEWFWRVLLNPTMASKVMMLPTFVFAVLKEKQ